MSSKVTKVTKTTKTVVEASGDAQAEPGETKTALLTSSGEKMDNGKNGSHDATSTTVTMEYADGENTPDSNKMNRKLSHIKKRVSQEFTKSSRCRKWVTWLIHLAGVTVPYAAILVGAIYRDECPANRNIPMHLIVTGVVTAILHLSTSIDTYRKLSYLKDNEKPAILTLTSLFLFIWMILGCVWVFGIFTPDSDYGMWNPQGFGYCHRHLYWFAFVFNLVFLVSVVVSFFLCCCVCNLLCNITILTCLCVAKVNKARGHDEEEASTPVQV